MLRKLEEKPFLTVETGEAYQPVRLTYEIENINQLIKQISALKCIEKSPAANAWYWFWRDECDELEFSSATLYEKNPDKPERIAVLHIHENRLYILLPSFKRASLAVSFFYNRLGNAALLHYADFINKIFAMNDPLPRGIEDLFKDDELNQQANQRLSEYMKIKEHYEYPEQDTAPASDILDHYRTAEQKQTMPIKDRYVFKLNQSSDSDPEVVFLTFHIFMRSRELAALKAWVGEGKYTHADITGRTLEKTFGVGLESKQAGGLIHRLQGMLQGYLEDQQ